MRLKFTSVDRFVGWGIVAVAYFITAQVGFAMAIPPGNVTAVWPPSGIALAAVMLLGYRTFPGIWLGSFVANIWSFAGLSAPMPFGVSLATAAGIAIGSTLQAWMGAYLIQRWIGSNNPFDRTQDVFKFVGIELISCLVAATFGATSLAVGRFVPLTAYPEVWWTWWLGDLVGIIVVTPAVIAWAGLQPATRDVRRLIEATVSLVLLLVVGLLVFNGPPRSSGALDPLSYTFIPFIVWAAVRFGPHGVTASILIVSATAIWGTARGSGPFVLGSLNESLIALQTFIAIETVTGLTLMASLREREQAEQEIKSLSEDLERRVIKRTAQLAEVNAQFQFELIERQRAEEMFRGLLESAPDAMVIVNEAGRIVMVNSQVEKIFSYQQEELLNQLVEILIPDRYLGHHSGHRTNYFLQPRVRSMGKGMELYGLRKDGSEFPVEISLSPLDTEQGVLVTAAIRDITERKQMEEKLLASEVRYRRLFETAKDGILILEAETGAIQDVNPFLIEMLGYSHTEFLGKQLWEIGLFKDIVANKASFQELQKTRYIRYENLPLETKDGPAIWVEFVSNVYEVNGKQVIQCNIRDITERKRAEEAMLEAASKVLAIFSTIGDGITVSDPEGRILEANDAAVRLHGFENKDEFLKAGISELVSDADRNRLQSEGLRIIQSGGSSVFECTLRRKDGSLFDGELRLTRLGDPEQVSPAIIGITRDITERKQAEEKLRASEERYRDLVEVSPHAILVHNEGRWVFVNPAALKLLGAAHSGQLIGKPIWERIHPDYHQIVRGRIQQITQGQRVPSRESKFIRLDGSIVDVEVVAIPLVYQNLPAIQIIAQDITERKQAEEALQETQSFLQQILDTSPSMIFVKDEQGRAVFVNQYTAQYYGTTPEQLVSKSTEDVHFKEQEPQEFLSDDQEVIRTRRRIDKEELNTAPNGEQHWFHTVKVPLVKLDGTVQVFGISTDITELKRAEQVLRRQNDYLAALHEVTLGLINRLNPDDLLEAILTHLADLMKTRHAIVDIVDPLENIMINKVAVGNFVSQLGYRTARGEGLTGRVWDSGKMLIIPDYSTWKGALPEFLWLKTAAVLPLKVGKEMIGVIGITFDEANRAFTSEEIGLLQRFANLASIALDNARLYTNAQREIHERKQAEQQLAHRAAQLAILHQLGHDVVASLELERVCASTHRAVEQLMLTEAFFISLLDEEQQEIEYVYLFDMGKRWPSERIPLDAPGLTTHVIQTGTTIFIEDDASGFSQTLGRTLFGTQEDTRSVIVTPLKLGGKVIGAISAQHYQPNVYTADHVQILEMLANQVAIATQNARLFTERATLIQELGAKNAELDRFTHTVSHDLKSPLVTLRGFLYYLEKDAQSGNKERLQNDLQRINESVEKMQRLITELLELSQIGHLINPPVDVSFMEIVQDALSRVEGRLEARQIKVEIRGELPQVYGDRNRLVQVMQNLLDNAAKFMGDQAEPRIEIGTRTHNEKTIFYVKDNGMGINPEVQDKVFGLFDKLDAQSDGTGIGLVLVKRIIEVHGGKVWVESEGMGMGTAFCFTLE